MIRLVNQFDAPNTRVTAATPTCCCCCCCVISVLSTATFTALNLRTIAINNQKPIQARRTLSLLGALAILAPIIVIWLLGVLMINQHIGLILFISLLIWIASLYTLYRCAGHGYPFLASMSLAVTAPVFFVGEVLLALPLLFATNGIGLLIYLVLIPVGVSLAVRLAPRGWPTPSPRVTTPTDQKSGNEADPTPSIENESDHE